MPNIHFLTQADNQSTPKTANGKKGAKLALLTGYVSATGKLVLFTKTGQAIGNAGTFQALRVSSQMGKRKLTMLYLISRIAKGSPGLSLPKAQRLIEG